MIAQELINQMIPALKPSDTAEKAILWMEELKINQLPVVDKKVFSGMVNENMLLDSNNLDANVGQFQLQHENCYVLNTQHFFDILKTAYDNNSDLVAVIDVNNEYIGVTTYGDTFKAFSGTAAIQSQGSILVLSMRYIDYSLSDISRIIETNDAKIMSCFMSPNPDDSSKVFITLKINTTDLSTISVILERSGYQLIAKFHEEENNVKNLERIDNLLKFINI